MTKQRALLLSIFRSDECMGKHRTADELLELARAKMPGISRATVYNNLRSLEEEGLIRKITGEGGADFYDSSFVLHGHLICTSCHEIRDVNAPKLLDEFKRLCGADVDSYELKLRYVCEKCRTAI
jgi:Fe2+ or Zn2+ uptake regulation protein